ncbi:MAG: SPASM domain-containing protein, partial [Elusimicrobiota bacterium]
RGIKFSSGIYTNGYLLSAPAFLEYLDSGITFFQVTLDGNRETHDKVRSLRVGGGTFDIIWKNLCSIRQAAGADERFAFKIRVNFMKDQDAQIQELLEEYEKVFGSDPRFSIYFRAVSNMDTSRDDIRPIKGGIYGIEDGLSKQVDYYLNAANKLGKLDTRSRITAPVPDPIGGWCSAQKKNSWIIGADGLVFKCDTLIGDASTACGRLLENGTIESFNKTCAWDENIYDAKESKCLSCKFLPVCQGGCPRDRQNRLSAGKCYYTEATIEKAMKETHLYYKSRAAAAQKAPAVQTVGAEGSL